MKKFILKNAGLVALVLVICNVLCGCSALSILAGMGKSEKQEETKIEAEVHNDEGETQSKEIEGKTIKGMIKKPDVKMHQGGLAFFPKKITAEKIGSVEKPYYLSMGSNGIRYTDNKTGKTGIITLDGRNDTGAKYTFCSESGNFFVVSEKNLAEVQTSGEINYEGLVDAMGNRIIPDEYATVECLSDNYAKVCKVTGMTENKDECLVFSSNKPYKLTADENDILYKGNWYVYDIRTRKIVPGATGTKHSSISVNGNYISFENDLGEDICINASGQPLPEGAKLFEDGSYFVEKQGEGIVYDRDDRMLFTYKTAEYRMEYIFSSYGLEIDKVEAFEHYVAMVADNSSKYIILDRNGQPMSPEFNGRPEIHGNFIHLASTDGKIYDFNGNVLVDRYIKNVRLDKATKAALQLEEADGSISVMISDGKTFSIGLKSEIDGYYNNFVYRIKNGDIYSAYYYNNEDFSLDDANMVICPWVAGIRYSEGGYDAVDTISGEIIVEGYDELRGSEGDGVYYIYAKKWGRGSQSVTDIYEVKYK